MNARYKVHVELYNELKKNIINTTYTERGKTTLSAHVMSEQKVV